MFLEGEINWALVFGVVAAAATLFALFSMFGAGRAAVAFRNSQQALRAAEFEASNATTRLHQMLQGVPVALVETDIQGKFVFANRAAHQLLGRRGDELLGLRFHSATWGITYPDGRLIPPDLLPSARALRGQTVKGFQHIIANPSTRRRMLVSVTTMPILGENGEVIGSTAALVETEALHGTAGEPGLSTDLDSISRRVFDVAASYLVVVGPDGVIREANRTALEALGRTADGVVGQLFAPQFAPVERQPAVAAEVAALFAGRSSEPLETQVTLADGRAVTWCWRALPLTGEEGMEPLLLLAADELVAPTAETAAEPMVPQAVADGLTARLTQVQMALAEAERQVSALTTRAETDEARLAEAERARDAAEVALGQAQKHESVGRLTGGVAHDFNNMLGVIVGALEMMLRQADNPERVRRLGQAALTAGRRGERVTRELLAFTRRQDATEEPVEVASLLSGLEPRLRRAAEGARLTLEGPPAPLCARIDTAELEGALEALVRNAAQAAPGGLILVRAARAALTEGEVAGLEAGGYLRLSVTDNGTGMTPEVLARATEPFFTTRQGGAGLGLAQVQGFARRAGGAFTLYGAPEQGATANLYLPEVAVSSANAGLAARARGV